MSMENEKLASLWKLLNEYNFEIDIQNNSDLICCICKNLLKNAHQGVCGCLYCQECFKLFLSTDEKYCPGQNGQCREHMINIALSLKVDNLANKRIAGVIVKCPIDFCQFKDRLSEMEHHIETHSNGSRYQDCVREMEHVNKEILTMREEIREAQSENQNQFIALREEFGKLRAIAEFCKEEIQKLKNSTKNQNDAMKLVDDADMDEELSLLDFTEDDCSMDVEVWRKKKPSVLEPNFAVTATELVPANPHVPGIDYRSLIVTEVHRQTGDLRNALAEQEAELSRLKSELTNTPRNHGNSNMEPIDLTGAETDKSIPDRIPENSVPTQVSYLNPRDGKTSRRKLKRVLPPVAHVLELSVRDKCGTSNVEQSSEAVPVIVASEKVPQTAPDFTATQRHHSSPVVTPKPLVPDSRISSGPFPHSKASVTPSQPKLIPVVSENSKRKPKHVAFSTPKTQGNPVPGSKVVIHPVVLQRTNERPFIRATRSRGGRSLGNDALPPSRSRNFLHVKDDHRSVLEPPFSMRNCTPFELKIDKFANKIFQAKQSPYSIYSPPFYSSKNGYKLCLRVDPNVDRFGSNAYLGVFFCVLQGEFDAHLPWPMRIEVTISLIDQVARIPYTSRTFDFESAPDNWKHVFTKPSAGSSGVFWFGTPQFIHFDFLCNNSSLIFQDSIIIRCSTDSADLF